MLILFCNNLPDDQSPPLSAIPGFPGMDNHAYFWKFSGWKREPQAYLNCLTPQRKYATVKFSLIYSLMQHGESSIPAGSDPPRTQRPSRERSLFQSQLSLLVLLHL
jgi:hypothetical protein